MSKSRSFVFTLNNYTLDQENWLINWSDFKYVMLAQEIGESGTPHLQGYCVFKSPRSVSGVQKAIQGAGGPRMAIMIAQGSFEQNLSYIQGPYDGSDGKHKDLNPTFREAGQRPSQGRQILTWDANDPDSSNALEVMEDGDMVASWPHWEWQIPLGTRADRDGGICQDGWEQVVVRVSWSTGCYIRRLQAYKGDTLRVLVEPSRPLPYADRNEGWHDPDDCETHLYNDSQGSPGDIRALGMAWARESGPTTEADRTCHRVPPDGGLLQLAAEARAAWSDGPRVQPPAVNDLEISEEDWMQLIGDLLKNE